MGLLSLEFCFIVRKEVDIQWGGDAFGVVPVEESHESMLFGKSSNLELIDCVITQPNG